MIIEKEKDLPHAPANITMTLRAPASPPTKVDYNRASGSSASQNHPPAPKDDYFQASGNRATQSHTTTRRPPAVVHTTPSPRPEPPPYSEHSFPAVQPHPPLPSPSSRNNVNARERSFPVFQSPPPLPALTTLNAVNQLHINNHKEDVFGIVYFS